MNARTIYMTGIGGIGMSALAQMLKAQGKDVRGSDREESPTTALLAEKGIAVDIGQRAENVPSDCELLIYSDAVPEHNFPADGCADDAEGADDGSDGSDDGSGG